MLRILKKFAHRPEKEAAQVSPKFDITLVPKDVRSLVCQRCWSDLFGTSEFWDMCKCGHLGSTESLTILRASYRILRSQLAENAETCNWCSLIYWTISDKRLHERYTDLFVELSLPTGTFLKYTPTGSNGWDLVVGPEGERHDEYKSKSVYKSLEAYSISDDRAAKFVTARPVQVNVDTDSAYEEIKAWLRACGLHRQCPAQEMVRLPTRVVDVGSIDDPIPKLHSTEGKTGHYAALSYCWGGPQTGALNGDNLDRHLEAFDMDEMPQTIKDAIKVVRGVGLRYLWVDALCILQDSDIDKTHEIGTMDQTYRRALFTISAEMASSARDGFLSQRKPPLAPYTVPFRCSSGNFGSMSLNDLEAHSQPLLQPLQTRAWTFQESILSSRLLIYNSSTLRWYCRGDQHHLGTSLCHKDDPRYSFLQTGGNFLDRISGNRPADLDPLEDWDDAVGEYSARKHSEPQDRLVALSGIAKTLAEITGYTYLAGLWKEKLLDQLLWHTQDHKFPRPLGYRAPSWSWASVEGRVYHFGRSEDGLCCELIECKTLPLSANAPFGAVRDGWLTITGPMLRGRYKLNDNETGLWGREPDEVMLEVAPQSQMNDDAGSWRRGRWWIDLDTTDELSEAEADFVILSSRTGLGSTEHRSMSIEGLVLRDLHIGSFARIGAFSNLMVFDPSSQETIGLPDPRNVRII